MGALGGLISQSCGFDSGDSQIHSRISKRQTTLKTRASKSNSCKQKSATSAKGPGRALSDGQQRQQFKPLVLGTCSINVVHGQLSNKKPDAQRAPSFGLMELQAIIFVYGTPNRTPCRDMGLR